MKVDPNAKVLIVDDMSATRKTLIRTLRELGWNYFIEASDGEQAWEILQKESFQIVVSDWNMPKLSGIELLRKIRTNKFLMNLPFIMVTAKSDKEQVVDAIGSGANGYIVKPFTVAAMKIQVEAIAQQKK